MGLTGNPVRIGSGPAAVTGDKTCILPLFVFLGVWEGAGIWMIREPEDLPELMMCVMQRELPAQTKNITGPRKLGAALQVIKGLKGCFNFGGLFYMLCGIASSTGCYRMLIFPISTLEK